jgi:hypothetical protein
MLVITSPTWPTLRLKQAEAGDLEDLRTWKNTWKQRCFYKAEISPEQQKGWFAKLQANPTDLMLLAQQQTPQGYISFGCLGFRVHENSLEIYNTIRGRNNETITHTLTQATTLMLNWLLRTYNKPVCGKVLAANPTRPWFESLGFEVAETGSDPEPFIVYCLNPAKLQPVEVSQ